jgi:outer membrane protein OmpA-like peptidoglycan-associated protein
MKARFLFIGLFLLGFSLLIVAQETRNPELQTAGYKTSFAKNSAESNWFVHVGVGAQSILGDHDNKAKTLNRITVAPTVSLGKWFSPYWGVRLKGQGGSLHGFENNANYMQHIRYSNVHLDALWNLSNYWGAYSPEKVVNFTPYLGLGYGHKFASDKTLTPPVADGVSTNYRNASNVLSANGGIQLGFRINKRINLDFDLGAAIVPDQFDKVISGPENDFILSASGGLTFKLGKTTFESIVPFDQELINNLNEKNNKLRIENELLSKRPVVDCPECPIAAPVTTVKEVNYVPNVVFFRINSAKIEDNQQISIFNTAEFIKKTGEKIKVTGYADKNTGSKKYNLKLSEKRAKAVANELTSKYGISAQDISVSWEGDIAQPYNNNEWNRVVVMSSGE